jgi:hypothetical protein
MNRQCLRCNKDFTKKRTVSLKVWAKAKFCSRKCRKNPLKKCPVCNRMFRVQGSRQLRTRVWCSPKCRFSYPTIDIYSREYRSKPNITIGVGRRNAKVRGLSWELTLDQYSALVSSPCAYCENKIGNVQTELGAGLDRIDNSLGYTTSNVVPCCGFCNKLRSDVLTVEETKAAVEAILRLRTNKRN